MINALLFYMAHVPTYDGSCVDNCCVPPKTHTISQVIYLQGSGGLELHIDSQKKPFDIDNSEMIDFDIVFRDRVDPTTFDIYVGCGGCMPQDSIPGSFLVPNFQPYEIEPFTQTRYTSLITKENRVFNSSLLRNCTEAHFTVRMLDYNNRTDGKKIVWGAVIGLAEEFTFMELIEFPIYIIRNHGPRWNDLGWTIWICLIGAPVLILGVRLPGFFILRNPIHPYRWPLSLMDILYEIALIGFVAAGAEMIVHLIYVPNGVEITWAFWVGLFVVAILPQVLGILFTLTAWWSFRGKCCPCARLSFWNIPQIATGFSFLLLFGAGFYIGPGALMLAGILQTITCCLRPVCEMSLETSHITDV